MIKLIQKILLLLFLATSSVANNMEAVFASSLTDGSSILSLVLAFLAGVITAFSPCIYPLIPITLAVIGARRPKNRMQGFLIALCYVGGMALVYTALGAIFASFGMVLGAIMQHPVMLLLIALIFFGLGLFVFGFFRLVLPERFMTLASRVGGGGYKGSFLMGMVSGLLAAPCTGPVLAYILTLIAASQEFVFGVVLMSTFSLGLGLPFLLLGTFSSALALLPKSGRFLMIFKVLLGSAMIVTSLYYASLALQGFFPDDHSGKDFVIDHHNRDTHRLDYILNEAKAQGRAVMIDFYADWCVACHHLEKETFPDSKVAEKLKDFIMVKIDATSSSPYIDALMKRYLVVGLPTIVFINQSGDEVFSARVVGFLPPKEFLHKLEEALIPKFQFE